MNILTIDVGIKNLALCYAEKTQKLDIKLWEVYDLISDKKELCQSLTKKNKICNKSCSYKKTIDDEIYFYCKTHTPKDSICNKNLIKKKIVKNTSLHDLTKIIIQKIDDIFSESPVLLECEQVLIELQPRVNQKMKFTSHIIFGKLTEMYKNYPTKIKFISASKKLKLKYNTPQFKEHIKDENFNLKNYSHRKKLSIKYTEWYIKDILQDQTLLEKFLNNHKKDDMSDTFLMILHC